LLLNSSTWNSVQSGTVRFTNTSSGIFHTNGKHIARLKKQKTQGVFSPYHAFNQISISEVLNQNTGIENDTLH